MKATISGGGSTQSRGCRPGKPVALSYCSGVYEYSTDGRKILSWPMGQFGGLLGFPNINNPLTEKLVSGNERDGEYFSGVLPHSMRNGKASLGSYPPESEQCLADKLANLYSPYLRSPDIGIRFFSNGTDATQCAVTLARYAAERSLFVSSGYHGGSSPVFAFKPQNEGVIPQNSEYRFEIEFGTDVFDLSHAYKEIIENSAAVIVEVPSVEDERKAAEWLELVSDESRKSETCFILDDIVTGFRFAPAGALEYYSNVLCEGNGLALRSPSIPPIQADFICLGKALSTYGKVSALLGPRDAMEALSDKVFASYTFNDHPLGFVDALWTLGEYEKHADRLYDKNMLTEDCLWTVGTTLKSRLNYVFKEYNFPAKCIGHPARSAIVPNYDDGQSLGLTRAEMINTLLARVVDEHDILLHRPNFVTLSHGLDHVSQTLSAVETVLKSMQ